MNTSLLLPVFILHSILQVFVMPHITDFPAAHIADIHYYYGLHRGSARAAHAAYVARYPNRQPVPSARIFQEVHRRLATDGLRFNRGHRVPPVIINVAVEEAVLRDLWADPYISTRRLALRHDISQSSVWRILKKEGLHPYHHQRVQHLHEDVDNRPRCVMSAWIQRKIRENQVFWKTVLWMDESQFMRDGITNCRNLHKWCPKGENPKLKRASSFQVRFSINVWAGIMDDTLIGPIILPRTLNAERFLELLSEDLPPLLEDVPLAIRRRMILQMDGCPAHYARTVRNFLNEHYPNRWIGRSGPVGWPARSPDMTPLDYFLWGTMKQTVYATPVDTEDELRARILSCAQQIKEKPDMIRRATQQILVRAAMCLQQRGGHFEHLMH